MNSLQEIRIESGMSQWQLAQWLGISRGHYSMAEIGKRSLPGAASLKLHYLYQCLTALNGQSSTAVPIAANSQTVEKTKTRLLKLAARKRFAATALQQKLDDCLQKKQATDKLLSVIEKMRQGDASGLPGHRDRLVLEVLETDCISKRDKMQDQLIFDLQLKIKTLHYTADFAAQLVAEMDAAQPATGGG